MYLTYIFDWNPVKMVYDIWHTPEAFGHGNLISIPQAREAMALLEERGQNIPNAEVLIRRLKLGNLRGQRLSDQLRVLETDSGASFAIYTTNTDDSKKALIRVFSTTHEEVGDGARACNLPAGHIPKGTARRPIEGIIARILSS